MGSAQRVGTSVMYQFEILRSREQKERGAGTKNPRG
jgi:hypothetical protein